MTFLLISFTFIVFSFLFTHTVINTQQQWLFDTNSNDMFNTSDNKEHTNFELPTLADIKALSDPNLYVDIKDFLGEEELINSLGENLQVSRSINCPFRKDFVQEEDLTHLDMNTLTRIIRGVQYCATGYCSDHALEKWHCPNCGGPTSDSEFLLSFQSIETDTSGFIVVQPRNKAIVIIFRGSKSVKNWFNNFKFFKRAVDWENVPNGVLAHRGFYLTYMVIRKFIHTELERLLEEYRGYSVDFFGHSLGGAIATLAALDCKAVFLPKLTPRFTGTEVNLITHGQPRVGNKEFFKYFNQAFFNNNSGDAFRVVTYADVVPHVPPMGLGFSHNLQEIWISKEIVDNFIHDTLVCSETDYEDHRCSNAINPHELRVEDHSYAWNITFGICY